MFFILLRQRTGEYHTDKFWKCYISEIKKAARGVLGLEGMGFFYISLRDQE